jgi:hypothetical protein
MMQSPSEAIQDKLRFGFRLVTGRQPTEKEISVLEASWHEDHKYYSENVQQAQQLIAIGESKSQAPSPAELAAFTLAGNVLLNLDEVITRE